MFIDSKREDKRDEKRERRRDRHQNDVNDKWPSEPKQQTSKQWGEKRHLRVTARKDMVSPESSAHSSDSEEAKLLNGTEQNRTSGRETETSESETSEEHFVVKSNVLNSTQDRTLENVGKLENGSNLPAEPKKKNNGTCEERKMSLVGDAQRKSISEGFPGATNKKMMLSMLYGQKSMDDLKVAEHPIPGLDLPEQLDETTEKNLEEVFSGNLHATVENRNHVQSENEQKNSLPSTDFNNLVNKAKEGLLMQRNIDTEEESKKHEEERQKQEELRRKQEEEEAARRAEEAARLQELEWERMITLKRSLIVKDFDFTDLGDDDDDDVCDPHSVLPGDVTDAPFRPPPIPLFGVPPPPPPVLGGPPPPPPIPGGVVPPPPPPGVKSGTETLNKKKMVRLFWQEVKNSPLINGVNKTIWGSIDHVDVDTKKLEHLFENKINPKLKVCMVRTIR